jgi:hypothetical protein
MKINRRQLRRIIQESINESKFGDIGDKVKGKVKGGVSKLVQDIKGLKDLNQDSKETNNKDELGGQEEEAEESRKGYVDRILSEYEYHLGASGKLLAKKTAQGVKLDLTFKIVGSLPGNFNIYVRQPNGSSFAVLRSRTINMLGIGRGLGQDPSDVHHITTFIANKFIELGGKPASSLDQTADQDNLQESLSRGSLYRRKYHGRY